jgi:hypothetical protein
MGKRKTLAPEQNDWLFSCSARLPTKHIVTTLGVAHQPLTELSAQYWNEQWRMGNDLLRAYDDSVSYTYEPGQNIANISNSMGSKSWEPGELAGKGPRFVGETFVIRECKAEIATNLTILVDIVAFYLKNLQKMHLQTDARLIVVLAGWTEPILTGRPFSSRLIWAVNPLPQMPPYSP